MTIFTLTPIGHVAGGRTEAIDDDWGDSRAVIRLDPERFTDEALLGLEAFSHAEIIFLFDQVADDQITTSALRPRGNPDWPRVGIFTHRGKNWPNRLGDSVGRIFAVKGLELAVEGLEVINGTPLLDIKPVMVGFQPRGEVRKPDRARAIMAEY